MFLNTKFLSSAILLSSALALSNAQTKSGSIMVDGAKIAYRVAGHGPAMFLIHGYPLSGELFSKNRTALAKHYTVVTPDLRGFGDSTAPDGDGQISIYAKDMFAVMNHLHIKKAIIGGMSMGGPVTLEMYREQPKRFKGMILIDSNTGPASLVEKAEWPGFGDQAAAKGVKSLPPLLLSTMLTAETRKNNPALVKQLTMIVNKGSVNGAQFGGKVLATRPDSSMLKISVPVLIIGGFDDPLYAMEVQMKMHKAIKGSKLVLIPGAAHASNIEKPAQTNSAILSWAAMIR